MHLFWKQGYEQTSVQDLGQALAVHPGTLYDTFGDKHALLLSVLDRYVKTVGCQVLDVLKEPGPRRQAIERLFAVSVARLTSETGSYGCLITNIAMERAYCDAQTTSKPLKKPWQKPSSRPRPVVNLPFARRPIRFRWPVFSMAACKACAYWPVPAPRPGPAWKPLRKTPCCCLPDFFSPVFE